MPQQHPTGHDKEHSQTESQERHARPNIEVPEAQNLQPSAHQSAPAPQNYQQVTQPRDRLTRLNIGVNLFLSFMLVVFTGFYAWHSSKQSDTMQAAFQQTRESREQELRAYISVSQPAMDKPLQAGGQSLFSVTFLNAGKTPALEVRTRMQAEFRETPPENFTALPASDTPEGKAAILPGGLLLQEPMSSGVLTEESVNALKNARKQLYVWGYVTYQDVFGHSHRSEFSYLCRWGSNALQTATAHNTMD